MTDQVIDNGNISDEAQEGNVTIEKSNASKSAAQNASKNKPVPTRKQQIEAAAKAELPNGAAIGTISKIQSLGEYLVISVKTEDGVKPVVVPANADTQALGKGDGVAFGGGVYQRLVLKADGTVVEELTLLAQTLELTLESKFYVVSNCRTGNLKPQYRTIDGKPTVVFGGLIGQDYDGNTVVVACPISESANAVFPRYVATSIEGDNCVIKGRAVVNLTSGKRAFRAIEGFRNHNAVVRARKNQAPRRARQSAAA